MSPRLKSTGKGSSRSTKYAHVTGRPNRTTGKTTWYIQVRSGKGGARRRVATRCTSPEAAAEVLARLNSLVTGTTARWDLMEQLHAKTVSWAEADYALASGGISALEALLAAQAAKASARHMTTPLLPLVDAWPALFERGDPDGAPADATLAKRRGRVRRYARACGTLAGLTTKALKDALATAGGPTTQREHRAALVEWGAWLVSAGHLPTNPAVGLRVAKGRATPVRSQEFAVLMAIYEAMDVGPARDAFGFMIATGVETGTVRTVTAADVDGDQLAYVHGTKNDHRRRSVIVERWFWPRLQTLATERPSGPLMTVDRKGIAAAVRAAVARVMAADPTLTETLAEFVPYHARHSWAVRWLRDRGASAAQVAAQFGHINTQMVIRLYGRWVPSVRELLALEK